MQITYKNIDGGEGILDLTGKKSAIILGANGSGKSSLGRSIKNTSSLSVLRIPSQKDLFIPKQITFRDEASAFHEIGKTRGYENKGSYGSGNAEGNNEMIDDFTEVISALMVQHTSAFSKFGEQSKHSITSSQPIPDAPESMFETVRTIWEKVFVGSSLSIDKGKLKMNDYDLGNISDGERSALYLLAKCMLDTTAQIIIIDEPESHLNSALINELWHLLEKEKPDQKFIYMTHSIEFAEFKDSSEKYWIKQFNYTDQSWKIEKIDGDGPLPKDLLVSIIGTKKSKILFCEGQSEYGTRDYRLYRYIYPEFRVFSNGGCGDVIRYVKALRAYGGVYDKEFFGLIDRDFRESVEITELQSKGISSLPVTIYENLFLFEEIINEFTTDEVIRSEIKDNVRRLFSGDLNIKTRNKDKLKTEFRKKEQEFKSNSSKPANITITVDFDWTPPPASIVHDEILVLLKSKEIKNVPHYDELVEFVYSEVQKDGSNVLRILREKLPALNSPI